MNNKVLMGACAVVLVAILAGTYLWIDVDNDDDTITWHATHYEYILNDGTIISSDAEVNEEMFPLTILQRDGWMFIGEDDGCPMIGILNDGFIMYEYQYEEYGNTYNVYAEGIVYDSYMNVTEFITDFDTEEPLAVLFIQYTLDGKPAASMEGSYFDFDIPFTPIDCMHYENGTATSVPVSPLVFKDQEGMFASFDMEVLGVNYDILLVGGGYADGVFCASGFGYIDGDLEYIVLEIADGVAKFLFTCTSATGEAYYISSTYSVPYMEGEHWAPEDIEGSWTCDLYSLYADGSNKHRTTDKIIEKVDDNYYTCTEVTPDNGTFTWDIYVDGNYIDVRVYRTIDGTTEEIGHLVGNSYSGFMFLSGLQYSLGYVDGYAVTFYMYKNA